MLNKFIESASEPDFLFNATGLLLESLLFLFVFFSLIWVMKKAKSAKKLYITGTSMHLISLFWIFFGPTIPASNAIGLCLFFFGSIIMAIALTEEYITDGVRAHVEHSRKSALRKKA